MALILLVPLGVEINPWFYQGREKASSKAKTGELKASPSHLPINKTSKYNSKGLATALLKYKEALSNEI